MPKNDMCSILSSFWCSKPTVLSPYDCGYDGKAFSCFVSMEVVENKENRIYQRDTVGVTRSRLLLWLRVACF